MFGDLNKVAVMGNIVRDPDMKYIPNGSAVVTFAVATNRKFKKGEEWKEEATFHDVVVWNNAEALAAKIHKGTRIYVEGRIQTRSWDKDGKKQFRTEIIAERVILIAKYEDTEPTVEVEELPF